MERLVAEDVGVKMPRLRTLLHKFTNIFARLSGPHRSNQQNNLKDSDPPLTLTRMALKISLGGRDVRPPSLPTTEFVEGRRPVGRLGPSQSALS